MSRSCRKSGDAADHGAGKGFPAWLGGVARSWFSMTVEEQWAVTIIVGLALLGITMRLWHMKVRAGGAVLDGGQVEQRTEGAIRTQ